MKHIQMITALISFTLGTAAVASNALADNAAVEKALADRKDLSDFYQAFEMSGVNHELTEGTNYSVFAPTNSAFATIGQKYPCFYSAQCKMEVAQIVRNHIIEGEVHISDAVHEKGGLYSLNQRFISIGEPNRNTFALDGNNVTYTTWLAGGGMLYKIDGIIANPTEMASVEYQQYNTLPAQISNVDTVQKTIADPACGAGGCPDSTSRTTSYTHTVVTAPSVTPSR